LLQEVKGVFVVFGPVVGGEAGLTVLDERGDEAFFFGLREEGETGIVDVGVFVCYVSFVEAHSGIAQTATDTLPLPNNRRNLLQGGKGPLIVACRILEALDHVRDGFGGVVGFIVGEGGAVAVEGGEEDGREDGEGD